jgi:hypothetical protein
MLEYLAAGDTSEDLMVESIIRPLARATIVLYPVGSVR